MVLASLEERLNTAGNLERFNEDISGLDTEVKNLIRLLFGVASELCETNHRYVLHGGYAVLLHLADCLGTKAIAKWRGSYDLDLIVNEEIVNMFKTYLIVISDRKSPNIQGKRTLRIILDKSETPYKLDVKMIEAFARNSKEIYGDDVETLTVYGIPVRVPRLTRLLRDKLIIQRNYERDTLDIINLIGIHYLKHIPPEEIVEKLTLAERKRLYELIKDEKGKIFIKENILIDISDKYKVALKKQLRTRIR